MWHGLKGQTAAGLITHQIPLFGEQRVTHVDFNIIDISVASLLTTETLLLKDILHLWKRAEEIAGHGRSQQRCSRNIK